MVKTGGPYLESGESIFLTTDRVRINTVQYDVLLTTRHLILVETTHTRFQPKMYPLISIQSVKGGKTTNGELVISLFFNDTDSESSGPMVLVFSQLPGEQRISERDEWIKKLMKLIVSGRQESSKDVGPAADDLKTGIMPSMRRTFAPEMSLPYKTARDIRPAHAEMVIIPDEPEPAVIPDETGPEIIPAPGIVGEMTTGSDESASYPETLLLPIKDRDNPPPGSEQAGLPDIPQSPILDTETSPAPSDEAAHPETLQPPIQDSDILPPGPEQVVISPDIPQSVIPDTETSPAPSDEAAHPETFQPPIQDSDILPPGPEQVVISPDIPQSVIPDSGTTRDGSVEVIELQERATPMDEPDTGALTAVRKEGAGSIITPVISTPEEIPPAIQNNYGSPELLPLQDQAAGSSFYYSPDEESEPLAGKAPEENGESLSLHAAEVPSPPPETPPMSPDTGSRKQTFIAVTAIMIVILLLAALALSFSANQVPAVVEPVPVPPATVQQTTPVPTQIIIPPTGIWVRVEYPGDFYGWLGIPGSLMGVNSSGSVIYRIPDSAEIIQVNMYKRDNSGNPLSVEVIRDGRVLTNRTITVPMGFIELLIDAKTGIPPGLTPLVTPSANQTGSRGGRIMYF